MKIVGTYPCAYYSYVGSPYDERLDVCQSHACISVYVNGEVSRRNVSRSLGLEEELARFIFMRMKS